MLFATHRLQLPFVEPPGGAGIVTSRLVTGPKVESALSKSDAFPTTRTANRSLCTYFCADALHVLLRHFLNPRSIPFQKIRRIAVELITHPLSQHFFLGVEPEDEGVQNGFFGSGQFLRRDGICFQRI